MNIRKLTPILVTLLMLGAAIALKIQHSTIIELLQYKVFDTFQELKPRTYSEQPVTILDLDDETLEQQGQWPWPRHKLATLVEKLKAMGVASIAMDIVFAEPDRTSPQKVAEAWKDHQGFATLLSALPDHDEVFAQAIENANITTGFILTHGKEVEHKPAQHAGYAVAGNDPKNYITNFNGTVKSLDIIEAAAAGNGALNNIPDKDGLIRNIPLVFRMGDTLYPSLAMEALRIAQGASGYIIKAVGASNEQGFGTQTGITAIKNGEFVIPTDSNGRLWLYYTPSTEQRVVPLWKILNDEVPAERMEGQIVFIGTSASGLRDIRSTPMNPVTSGVEIHAQALEQILSGEYLSRPDWIHGAEIVLMAIAGLTLIIILTFTSALIGALFTLLSLGGAAAFSWFVFNEYGILVDPVTPGIAIIIIYISGSLAKHILAEQERAEIRNAFSHYMSPDLVQKLVDKPDSLKLGGESKELTLLFCDIRGFTTLSESLKADELTLLLNRFLTPMTDIILHYQGTIDKYMGDCIMAFWNAPLDDDNHHTHACQAALAMTERLKEFNAKQAEEAAKNGTEPKIINIGIGLNTGICSVGNMGSDQRFDYSALGDPVNLASRLEGLCKLYSVPIIIGENTTTPLSARDDIHYIEIDNVAVKGKNEPVAIFTIMDKHIIGDTNVDTFKNDFAEMLNAYRSQSWLAANAFLDNLEFHPLSHFYEGLLKLYRQRVEEFESNPPEENWDGVYRATTK